MSRPHYRLSLKGSFYQVSNKGAYRLITNRKMFVPPRRSSYTTTCGRRGIFYRRSDESNDFRKLTS